MEKLIMSSLISSCLCLLLIVAFANKLLANADENISTQCSTISVPDKYEIVIINEVCVFKHHDKFENAYYYFHPKLYNPNNVVNSAIFVIEEDKGIIFNFDTGYSQITQQGSIDIWYSGLERAKTLALDFEYSINKIDPRFVTLGIQSSRDGKYGELMLEILQKASSSSEAIIGFNFDRSNRIELDSTIRQAMNEMISIYELLKN